MLKCSRFAAVVEPACRQAGWQTRTTYHLADLNRQLIMYYAYVIRSISKVYTYVGISNNPQRRIAQHNTGYSKTTKPYRPFEVILIEEFPDRELARKREKYLKSGFGKEYLKMIR